MSQYPELVKQMLQPDFYPDKPPIIELLQTQMSFIFLAGDYVYKIKKPVNLGYLDYTTLENRKYFCEQEVRLNQRLCGKNYIGVFPIALKNGKYAFGSTGKVVEYAVKMRKLPAERMMDVLLAQNKVTPQMITSVANKIAVFHRQAETGPEISKFGNLETIIFNTEENFSQTEKYIGLAVTREQHERLAGFTRSFIKSHEVLFHSRVTQGKIKDCHGDLHSQHVCFIDDICIYDCIEFNDRFRYEDVAAEVSFLSMDLDKWGHPELSQQLVSAYTAASGDNELQTLVNFYKCYYAYVRAKVSCFKYDSPSVSATDKQKALKDARQYFALAESYI